MNIDGDSTRTILVKTMLDRGGFVVHFGILETCCFPASFYAYFVTPDGKGGYRTTDHATHLYHRSVEEAQREFDRLFPHYESLFAEQRKKWEEESAHLPKLW